MSNKPLLVLLVMSLLSAPAAAQSFTETLRYLNDKLNSEASQTTRRQGQKIVWTVTNDGRLITKLMHRDGYSLDTKSYYLKTLCNSMNCTEIRYIPPLPELNGQPSRFEGFTSVVFRSTSGQTLMLDVDNEEAANRIKNAVFRLVTLAKANKTYKSKDPFDY